MWTWVLVMVGVILIVVTPFFLRRGAYAHADDPRLGVRQKTPWVIAVVLVLTLIATPLSFAWVVSSRHPRNEALYMRTLHGITCFRCRDFGTKRPLAAAMRRNPSQFIAAGDEACQWLASRPFMFVIDRAQTLEDRYVQDADPVATVPAGNPTGRYVAFFKEETKAAWKYLCRGTLETRTLWPIRTWKDYYND
jgi:hypothetical protein